MGVKSNSNELCISFSFYGITQICKYYKVYFFTTVKKKLFQILILIFMISLFKRIFKVAVILVVDALEVCVNFKFS